MAHLLDRKFLIVVGKGGARIKELGMEADPITRAGFDKEWRADMVTWARLVKQSGATAD